MLRGHVYFQRSSLSKVYSISINCVHNSGGNFGWSESLLKIIRTAVKLGIFWTSRKLVLNKRYALRSEIN